MSQQNQTSQNYDNQNNTKLSRDMGLLQITMMGVGMMIGAGIFVATGLGIGVSGSGGILIAFALNGLLAFFSSMAYAELASAIPSTGGGYTYVREAFGGVIGFMGGWMSWLGHAISGSLYAITFSKYSVLLFRQLEIFKYININVHIFEKMLAVAIVLVFVYINYRGSSETGNASIYITFAKIAVLLVIAGAGIFMATSQPERLSHFSNFLPKGWGKVLVTMGLTYIGFEGFEVIAQTREETLNPKKNIPKAIFYSIVIVVTIYILVAFAAVIGAQTGNLPIWQWFKEKGITGFDQAVKNLIPYGGILVAISAMLSSTSALNATTYSSSRVSYALGKNRSLPKMLGNISKKTKTPTNAIAITSIIIVVVAVTFPVEDVAAVADIMFLLLFLFVNLSIIKIRRQDRKDLEYGYIMPYFPYIPVISIIMQMILSFFLFDLSLIAWITGVFWVLLGLFIYYKYTQKGRFE